MDKVDLFSVICGLLAICITAQVQMALGYEGMSFARPWPQLSVGAVLAEVLLMRWMGPAPGMLLMALCQPLEKRWPRAEMLGIGIFFLCIPATAVGLAFGLLSLMRRLVN